MPPIQAVYSEPLFDAVKVKDAAEVQRLLSTGAYDRATEDDIGVDLEIEEWIDYLMVTPLFAAVVNRDVRCAELLLKKKADVNRMVQKCGHATRHHYASITSTPLAAAANGSNSRPDKDMVELLLRYGADPDIECIEEDFNGMAENHEIRTYAAKDRCGHTSVGEKISNLLNDTSSKKNAAIEGFMVPLGALVDEEDIDELFLTHGRAKELLYALAKAGNNGTAREDAYDQWGFANAREAEVSLKAAVARDTTRELEDLMDNWRRRCMKRGGGSND